MAEAVDVSPSLRCHWCPRTVSASAYRSTFNTRRVLMSRWPHPTTIPYQGIVPAWSLPLRSSLPPVYPPVWHCTAWMSMLSLYTLYRELLSQLLGSWPMGLVFLSRKKEEVPWTQFLSINGALVRQDGHWPSSNSKLSCQSDQLQIWASDPRASAVWSIIAERKY